jgi:hypothetical protein
VTNNETSVLSTRLHRLADDLTPQLDVVAQVRGARERNRRQRRGRIAFLSVATATAAVVVGTTTAVDLLSASADREVAGPALPTVPTTEPAPTTEPEPAPTTSVPATPTTESEIPVAPSDGSTVFPDGWEDRSFMGVTFMVPPGASAPDSVHMAPSPSNPSDLTWHGQPFGNQREENVGVTSDNWVHLVRQLDGHEPITIPGAEEAYILWTDALNPGSTGFLVLMRADDRRIHVHCSFEAGPEGKQKAQHVLDSIVIG